MSIVLDEDISEIKEDEAIKQEIPVLEGKSGSGKQEKRPLNWIMLTFMTYIAVFGGGAYSIEAQVATGYPLLTLVGLVVFPWIAGFPLALVTAELSSAMPDNSGFILWLEVAFGKFWGFFIGWIRAVNRVIDLSLYPVLFTSYLKEYFDVPRWISILFSISIVCVSSVINIFGVKIMGVMAIVFSLIALLPFGIFIALGITKFDPSTWLILPPKLLSVNWGLWLAVASWNVAGFDSMSQVAGEMKNPKKYYWAMMGAMLLIALSGFVPVALMVSIDRDYSAYYAGYWPQLGQQIAGSWLKLLFVIGACVAMFATFNGYLFYGSMMFAAWCKQGLMGIEPLTWLNRYHSPWTSIILHGVLVFLLSFLDFEDLIQVSTALYCIGLVLNYSALIILRVRRPDMPRPYKICFGTWGVGLFIAPATLLAVLNIIFAMAAGWLHFGLICAFVALGPALWFLRRKIEEYYPKVTDEQSLGLLEKRVTPNRSASRADAVDDSNQQDVIEPTEEPIDSALIDLEIENGNQESRSANV